MKKIQLIFALLLSLFSFRANSQEALPKGFVKGSIILADNSKAEGFIKEEIKHKAAVIFMSNPGAKKITYDGDKINGLSLEGINYKCIKGDFFKLISDGEICFLQKQSDASSKPVYVGNEAMFINGTEGKPGDYFIYNAGSTELKLVTSKNIDDVSKQFFAGCEPALSKAKETGGNVGMLKDAVVLYNTRNSK